MVRSVGTKSPDLPCPCVEWVEIGSAVFEVPSGQEYTLRFEKVFGRSVTLEGSLEDGSDVFPFRETVTLPELTKRLVLSFAGGEWAVETDPSSETETGFEIWWLGRASLHTASPAEHDEELKSQLRALGYVE